MPAVPAQAAEARRSRVKGQPVLLETLSKKKKNTFKNFKICKERNQAGDVAQLVPACLLCLTLGPGHSMPSTRLGGTSLHSQNLEGKDENVTSKFKVIFSDTESWLAFI